MRTIFTCSLQKNKKVSNSLHVLGSFAYIISEYDCSIYIRVYLQWGDPSSRAYIYQKRYIVNLIKTDVRQESKRHHIPNTLAFLRIEPLTTGHFWKTPYLIMYSKSFYPVFKWRLLLTRQQHVLNSFLFCQNDVKHSSLLETLQFIKRSMVGYSSKLKTKKYDAVYFKKKRDTRKLMFLFWFFRQQQ